MGEYKRFTKKDKYGHWYTDTKINDRFMWSKDGKTWERDLTHCAFDGESIDRLAELEDKIDSGLLVEQPCKVGDTVYRVYGKCDGNSCPYSGNYGQWRCNYKGKERCKAFIDECNFSYTMLNEIGKNIFVTKEAAEAKLKKLTEVK